MRIIGITGAIGHGKTSLAEALLKAEPLSVHLESFHVIAEVADAMYSKVHKIPSPDDVDAINEWLANLPKILVEILHLERTPDPVILDAETLQAGLRDWEKLFIQLKQLRGRPDLAKQKISDANKVDNRAILQWLGGYVSTHIDARAWYRELLRRAQETEKDGTQLAIIGGVRFPNDASVIREAGGKIIKIIRPGVDQADLTDPTERERELIQPDTVVINNGSLEDLQICATKILDELYSNQLAPRYNAQSEHQ